MSFIPDGFAEVSLKFNCQASPHFAFCVFGVDNSDFHNAEYIATNVRIDWDESLKEAMSEDWDLRQTRVVTGEGQFFEDNESVAGDQALTTAPPQVALLLRKQTQFIGRHNRGRMYIPGVPASLISDLGAVDSTFQGEVTALADVFRGKLIADGIPMYILHAEDIPDTDPIAVADLTCDAFVATQRRRLR